MGLTPPLASCQGLCLLRCLLSHARDHLLPLYLHSLSSGVPVLCLPPPLRGYPPQPQEKQLLPSMRSHFPACMHTQPSACACSCAHIPMCVNSLYLSAGDSESEWLALPPDKNSICFAGIWDRHYFRLFLPPPHSNSQKHWQLLGGSPTLLAHRSKHTKQLLIAAVTAIVSK